ncbi:MAG: TatD family hydrolase [Nanoarchaeota archaeon]|nr:TatD family hydrolase [Nanoarchaeota archaeon]
MVRVTMIPFIDIHCHLDYLQDPEGAIKRAKEAGVGVILTNGVSPITNRKGLALAKTHPEVKAALGFYPPDALEGFIFSEREFQEELAFIRANKKHIRAIGEVGMDFKDGKDRELQGRVFVAMITLAKELDVPLLIHTRKAEELVLGLLDREKPKKVILHCFCGKKALVKRASDAGYCFSVPTNIVRAENFQQLVEMVPMCQLFCETDSPYLSPFKERPNEPAFVVESYKKIAEIKKLDLIEVKNLIYQNYQRLF